MFESLSISELLRLIERENRIYFSSPIILEGKRMQIGFNERWNPSGFTSRMWKQELRDATLRAEIE